MNSLLWGAILFGVVAVIAFIKDAADKPKPNLPTDGLSDYVKPYVDGENANRELRRMNYGPGCSIFYALLALALVIVAVLLLTGCAPYTLPTRPATVTPRPTVTATSKATETARPVKARAVVSATPGFCVVSNTGGLSLNIRKAPGMDKEIVAALLEGTRVQVLGEAGEWLKINGGWIAARYCEVK